MSVCDMLPLSSICPRCLLAASAFLTVVRQRAPEHFGAHAHAAVLTGFPGRSGLAGPEIASLVLPDAG